MDEAVVDAETVAAYQRDGVACVRALLSPEEVERARRAIQVVLDEPSPLAQVASNADDPGAFTEDFCRWQEVPEIEALARRSRAPQVAAVLMGSASVRLYHDHVLVKEGGTRQRTPWHQDQPYYNVSGRGVSAWIPVDPVPLAGCLETLAATHLGPWLMPRTFLAGEAKWFPEGSLGELPDIDADRAAFDIRSFDMQPGDLLRLPHGARCPWVSVRRSSQGAVFALPLRGGQTLAAAVAYVPVLRRPRRRARRRCADGSPALPRRLAGFLTLGQVRVRSGPNPDGIACRQSLPFDRTAVLLARRAARLNVLRAIGTE